MSKKEREVEKTDSGDTKSKRVNDGMCCRCTRRDCEKRCKISGNYVARKHKCDQKINGKKAFNYKD